MVFSEASTVETKIIRPKKCIVLLFLMQTMTLPDRFEPFLPPRMVIVSRAGEAGRHPPGGRETIAILGEFLTLICQNLYIIEKSIRNVYI